MALFEADAGPTGSAAQVFALLSSAEIVAKAVNRRHLHGGPSTPSLTTIAQGEGWRIADIVCPAGPDDRPMDDEHSFISIALVVGGAFTYRSSAGAAELQSGSILLGNIGRCFTCGHDHGAGDRCIAFQFDPAAFERVLSDVGRAGAPMSFSRVALPASRRAFPLIAKAEAVAAACGDAHEVALLVVASVLAALGAGSGKPAPATAAHARAIMEIVRLVEEHPSEEASVAALAARAQMSPFHFIRCFKRVTGLTPHAFVRATRLREAARLLRDPTLSITRIAFECGFTDLSAFNSAFRQGYGCAPRQLRRTFARG